MKNKKLTALLLAATMMTGVLAGCGGGNDDDQADDGTLKTVTPGKLTVTISPDFAPTVFVDPSKEGQDRYVGTEVALARYIAQELGLELVLSPMSFEACQIAVSSGQADFSVNGYAPTDKRAENYLFSDTYKITEDEDEGQTSICLADKADKYTDLPNYEGLKAGVQMSSLQEQLTVEQLPNAEIVYYSDLNTGIMQLRAGDFDIMSVDVTNGKTMIASNPDLVFTGHYFDYSVDGTVALIQKGNDAMAEAINSVLPGAKEHYSEWIAEAYALSNIGIQETLDDQGNVVGQEEAN